MIQPANTRRPYLWPIERSGLPPKHEPIPPAAMPEPERVGHRPGDSQIY